MPAQKAETTTDPRCYLTVALMASAGTTCVELPVKRVAEFLNELGSAAVAHGLRDVQFWPQKRTGKAAAAVQEFWGVSVDVDREVVDVLAEVEDAGVQTPTLFYKTLNGFRVVQLFERAASFEEFESRAKELTLAFDGGDDRSWLPSQAQRLPRCLKTKASGEVVQVEYKAIQSNPVPQNPAETAGRFPARIGRMLGDGTVSPSVRAKILQYLEEEGLAPPDTAGSVLYSHCPLVEAHDSPCCYVRRAQDQSLSIVCLGGHDGDGTQRWSESRLASLAGSTTDALDASINPLRDLPITWGAVEYLRYRLRDLTPIELEAAVTLLLRFRARLQAESLGAPTSLVTAHIQKRLNGLRPVGLLKLHFAELEGGLAVLDSQGRVSPIRTKGESLSPKTHLHEWAETTAWKLTNLGTKAEPDFRSVASTDGPSLFNKALQGHHGALAALGIPIVRTYTLPVAHVDESWRADPSTRALHALKTYRWPTGAKATVDARDFFFKLFAAGRLPLATENDVLLLLMAIASPFLRHLAAGQLGIYWLHGPVGAGKDYTAESISSLWGVLNPNLTRLKFDLNLAGDMELRRSIAMAPGCIYARAKEAQKSPGMANLLIRLAGTDMLSARGLYKDELNVPNVFTYLADSAEDLPDRREISRRTVMIRVSPMSDAISKGDVLREIAANAIPLLYSLKNLVESRTTDWYLGQSNTGSRPLVPVALARLFGAQLAEVKGRDLDDLFDTLHEYVRNFGAEEGTNEKAKARAKDGQDAMILPSYRVSHFRDSMREQVGYGEILRSYKSSDEIVKWIQRETAYGQVTHGALAYHRVTIGDEQFAFKLVKSKRNFIFLPESEYLAKMGGPSTPSTPVAPAGNDCPPPPPAPIPPGEVSATSDSANHPLAFADTELLGGGDE